MGDYVKYRKPNPDAILGYSVITVDEENPLPVTVVPDGGLPVTDPGGGGGGAVDSVNGKTGVVVLNPADVGAVPSVEGDAYRAYITNLDGDNDTMILEGLNPLPVTIPVRTANGTVVTEAPVNSDDAATKGYVDGGFVGKLSGQGTVIATSAGVYGENSTSPGATIMLAARVAATANTIAVRGPNGRLTVGTPASDSEATTKQYVDLRVPVPPTTGGPYVLQSQDGVQSWVAA